MQKNIFKSLIIWLIASTAFASYLYGEFMSIFKFKKSIALLSLILMGIGTEIFGASSNDDDALSVTAIDDGIHNGAGPRFDPSDQRPSLVTTESVVTEGPPAQLLTPESLRPHPIAPSTSIHK